jgi:peptidoglycan/LPS O-acetylase OafA/YrhL
MTDRARLDYLDNLKVFLIILVILHHVGQAYGTTGGIWFYSYPGERVRALGLFFLFNASFFMGLFFFISGYFFPGSFDRHGARKFITEKFIRFGIPLIFASLIMIPLLEYVKYLTCVDHISFGDFYIRHWLGYAPDTAFYQRKFNLGHMWFVEHLLIYAILYAIARIVLQKPAPSTPNTASSRAGLWVIIVYILALGLVTHLVRKPWGFPINRWVLLLGFIQMEPAHLPQYASLFIIGIFAYRWSFLESITTPRNILWLVPAIGIYASTVVSLYVKDLQSAFFAWEFKEALLCVGMCIGLLALFRTFFNRTGRIMRFLSDNTFGAYVLHVPIVVAFQYAFDPVQAGAFTLFVIVSFLSIPLSFLASYLVRLIPEMKRVL